MIRYALLCEHEDAFEAWFGSSAEYDRQAAAGLIECPTCGSTQVRKALMAPAVARGRSAAATDERAAFEAFAAKVRSHIRETHAYVGPDFAKEARRMQAGEAAERPIWGEATVAEAKALAEEGAPVAPLPAPFAPTPPRKLN